MKKIKVSKECKVITYTDFWRTSLYLLKHGEEKERGSYFQFLGSLIFSSFAFEAFLNHIGENIFKSWKDLEKLSPRSKLNVISEKLSIKIDYGEMPWQIVPELLGFRNKVAHGKTTLLKEEKIVPEDEYERIMHKFLMTDWQKYTSASNCKKVRTHLEEIFKIIHKKANLGDDLLFHLGGQSGFASLVQE